METVLLLFESYKDSLSSFTSYMIAIIAVLVVSIAYYVMNCGRSASSKMTSYCPSKTSSRPNSKGNHVTSPRASINHMKHRSMNTTKSPTDPPLLDVWEERRRKGIAVARSSKTIADKHEKPFGSSYYYAHNNNKSKGGYQDGLQMEDFTMNQPRLLGKVPQCTNKATASLVHHPKPAAATTTPTALATTALATATTATTATATLITKYLWDDSGNGVASIWIEHLPAEQGELILPWADANIAHVSTHLPHKEGPLQVHLSSSQDQEHHYVLRIDQLYGPIREVKTIRKSKRLIVKLYKDGNKKDTWPHPYKKKV